MTRPSFRVVILLFLLISFSLFSTVLGRTRSSSRSRSKAKSCDDQDDPEYCKKVTGIVLGCIFGGMLLLACLIYCIKEVRAGRGCNIDCRFNCWYRMKEFYRDRHAASKVRDMLEDEFKAIQKEDAELYKHPEYTNAALTDGHNFPGGSIDWKGYMSTVTVASAIATVKEAYTLYFFKDNDNLITGKGVRGRYNGLKFHWVDTQGLIKRHFVGCRYINPSLGIYGYWYENSYYGCSGSFLQGRFHLWPKNQTWLKVLKQPMLIPLAKKAEFERQKSIEKAEQKATSDIQVDINDWYNSSASNNGYNDLPEFEYIKLSKRKEQIPLFKCCKCGDNQIEYCSSPCGHAAICGQCMEEPKTKLCPICDCDINGFYRFNLIRPM